MGRQYDLSVIFRVLDKATGPIRNVGKSLNKLGKTAESVGRKMKGLGQDLSLKVTAPLTLLAGIATKTAIDFESAFTGVRKTVDATEKQFAGLKKGLMDMALTVPLATTEIFGIAEAAGQLGIKQDVILGFTKVMADLGATTNITAREGAMQLARFATVTGMSMEDVDRLGATIVDLGNNTATTEAEIVALAMRLAGAGKTIGLTQAQIVSLAASLSSVGIEAEMGGSAFSRVMRQIDKEIGSGSQKMKDFALISGKSVGEFEKGWKENAGLAILSVVEGLADVQKEGENVNVILDALGFEGLRISDALLRASGAGDKFRGTMELGNKAWKENVALQKEANLRYGTTASKLQMARNRAAQLGASFGEILAPALLAIIKFLEPVVAWLTKLGPKTKLAIVVVGLLAAAIGPLLIMLGALAASIGVIAGVTAPVWGIIAAVTAAVVALGFAARALIVHWEPVKAFFVDLFTFISTKLTPIIDKAKSITGVVTGGFKSARGWVGEKLGFSSGAKEIAGAAGVTGKSETDINIRLIADEGTSASVEKVKRKKGDASVRIASVGYVGAQ